jgi:molybdate transport system substrate-binding protein
MGTNFKRKWLIYILVIYGFNFSHNQSSYAEDILIFSASSLTLPLQQIINTYQNKKPHRVRVSFAASSTLARQISRGAPADIYISANQRWMDFLTKEHPVIAKSKRKILSNTLVIIAPINSYLAAKNINNKSISNILGDSLVGIGDPDHVPLGIYSRQALTRLNLWHHIKNKLARLTNARAVLTLVERGETKAGIVYKSDAHFNKKIKVIFKIPSTAHDQINYWAALTRTITPNESNDFFNVLFNQNSKDIFKHHGFLVN